MGNFKNAFRGWGIKNSIIAPIIVNLISALIIFMLLLALKPIIFEQLGLNKGFKEYPIYCIAEAYNPSKHKLNEVIFDLFVINLSDDILDTQDLDTAAKALAPGEDVAISPEIKLTTQEGLVLEKIERYKEFNKGKGKLSWKKLDEEQCEISIVTIQPRGILKLKIYTKGEEDLLGINRGLRGTIPLEISYPGRK